MANSFWSWSPREAGFHQMPSLPGLAATIACPMPTACAPVGSSRKSEPSLPVGVCANAGATAVAASAKLERTRLIDQHDWDVVANGVAQDRKSTRLNSSH